MTDLEYEIMRLRGEAQKLQNEVKELLRQQQLDRAEIVRFRRQIGALNGE